MTAATYKILAVAPGRVVEVTRQGAPTEAWMCEVGKRRRASFVIRYYPSRKGWRLLDLRDARSWHLGNSHKVMWRGQERGQRYYPTEDAAVMAAMHMLGCTPTTT